MEAIDPFWSLTENYTVSPPRAGMYLTICKDDPTSPHFYSMQEFSLGRWISDALAEGLEILAFLYPGGNPTEVFTKLQEELKKAV